MSDEATILAFPKATPQKSSTERIWGKQVISHGYAGIPSILIKGQQRLGLNPTQMNILLQLLEYYRDPGRPPFPTKKALADRMGVSSKTIQTNMKMLEDRGYIQREQQVTAQGDYGSNIYHLDGLIKKVKEIEVDFRAEREKREAHNKRAETPVGRRPRPHK